MASTRNYPKRDPNGKFLVIPFNLGFSSFLTSEPYTNSCDECAVVSFEKLIEIQDRLQKLVASGNFQPFKILISKHEALTKKLIKKPMKGFGLGVFSKEEILPREHMIYSGNLLFDRNDNETKSTVYGLTSDVIPELSFDASSSTTLAKFFQHLPKKASSSIADQSPALKNFESLTIISETIFKKQRYLFPVAIFYACKKVPPDCMVGINYGFGYWKYRARPTHFKSDGTPIPDYFITTHQNEYGINASGLNRSTIDSLLLTQFIGNKAGILFLPKPSAIALANYMNKLPDKHGSQAIILPYILTITSDSHTEVIFTALGSQPAITIALPFDLEESEIKLLPKYLYQVHQQGKPYFIIFLERLKTASIAEIKEVVSYLEDFYGNDNFTLTESKIYKELTSSAPPEPELAPDTKTTQLLYSINPTPLFRKYQKPIQSLVMEKEEKPRINFI